MQIYVKYEKTNKMPTYKIWLIPYPDKNGYIPKGPDGSEQVVIPQEVLNALSFPTVTSIFLRPTVSMANTSIFVSMKDGRPASKFLKDIELLEKNCLIIGSAGMLKIIWEEFRQEGIELPTYLSERNLMLCAVGKDGFIPITPVVLAKS
jgi:hypothetical protein